MTNVYSKFFFDNFMRTPWFSSDTIGLLYNYLLRANLQMKTTLQQMSSILTKKRRAFFIEPQVISAMKKFFGITDDEEMIDAKQSGAVEKLIKAIRAAQGKKIYFILVTNIKPLHDRLTAEGFKYGSDYVNARNFLAENQGGVPMNSYEFIKTM